MIEYEEVDVPARPGLRAIVAVDGGTLVGSIQWLPWEGAVHVAGIYVADGRRGQGIGSELCRRFVEGPGHAANEVDWGIFDDGAYHAGHLTTEPIPAGSMPFAQKAIADVRARGLVAERSTVAVDDEE